MAKGQMRGNKEIRKPKQKKDVVPAATIAAKGSTVSIGTFKKK